MQILRSPSKRLPSSPSLRRAAVCFFTAASLSACGGSDGASEPTPVGPDIRPGSDNLVDVEIQHGTLRTIFPSSLQPSGNVEIKRAGRSLRFGARELRYTDAQGQVVVTSAMRPAEAIRDGETVMYRNVNGDADLVYRIEPGKVEQLLMLEQRPAEVLAGTAAKLELVEQVDFSGMTLFDKGQAVALPARLTTEGPLELRDGERTMFVIPSPEVRDASPGRARRAAGFKLSLSAEGKGVLATVVGMDYLMAAERQYPVAIDPSVSGHPCDISEHCEDENPCTIEACVAGGCTFAPAVAADGGTCWGTGTCETNPPPGPNPETWCVFPIPDEDVLADCTIGGPTVCRDGNPCTTDVCNAGTKQCENNANAMMVGQRCWNTGICTADGECEQVAVECVPSSASSSATLAFEDVGGPLGPTAERELGVSEVIDGVDFAAAFAPDGSLLVAGALTSYGGAFESATGDSLWVVSPGAPNQGVVTLTFPAAIRSLEVKVAHLDAMDQSFEIDRTNGQALHTLTVGAGDVETVSLQLVPPSDVVIIRRLSTGRFGMDDLSYVIPPGASACSTGNTCLEEVCVCDNPPTCTIGHCEEQNAANFDGDTCKGTGTCAAGSCILPVAGGVCGVAGQEATACDDGNPCTLDDCDFGGGPMGQNLCVSVPNVDANGDMAPDECWEVGQCHDNGDGTADCWFCGMPGLPDCDDDNPCTVDSCMGGVCDHDSSTTDGMACLTAGATCQDGQCVYPGSNACGGANACNDGNPCTADSCGAGGECEHAPVADFTPCWGTGQCLFSQCVYNAQTACMTINGFGGGDESCEDGNPCTTDACEPDGSCSHTPTNIGDPCWESGECTATGVCTF